MENTGNSSLVQILTSNLTKNSKTFVKKKDALKFLKELADAAEVKYDKNQATKLIDELSPDTDYITLKQFQILFFQSTEAMKIGPVLSFFFFF